MDLFIWPKRQRIGEAGINPSSDGLQIFLLESGLVNVDYRGWKRWLTVSQFAHPVQEAKSEA
ncbi:hypothetical protein [Sphingorhabdus sp. 109]|jgi:hypothetical protein|uniref:hypothetical protein n=1 Tax=Sphingorhabdus sp. 109 TaxID=2653173 RepID=UPI001357CB82|nr:hypothetical protein [Sphingorhabdus sp. 109]